MIMLRIEHAVLDYEAWKRAFDSDPVGRGQSGVLRYQVFRAVDNQNDVMIDLEFETPEAAAALLVAMRAVWGDIQGTLIAQPRACVAELVEAVELRANATTA